MTKNELIKVFTEAKEAKAEYIAVKILTCNLERTEIIAGKYKDFNEKLNRFITDYDENLILYTYSGTRIIKAVYGNTLMDVEMGL